MNVLLKKLPFKNREIYNKVSLEPRGYTYGCLETTPITSTYRYKYYLLIIDEFSRFTWLYPLETKDQVFSCIKEFQFMIEKSLDSSIKSIQSDCGGKF